MSPTEEARNKCPKCQHNLQQIDHQGKEIYKHPYGDPIQCPICKTPLETDWEEIDHDNQKWWFTGKEATTQFKGIPGPWTVIDKRDLGDNIFTVSPNGTPLIRIANTYGDHINNPKWKANAILIASSPQLLSTLIKLRNHLTNLHESNHPLIQEANQTIAKATGEINGA